MVRTRRAFLGLAAGIIPLTGCLGGSTSTSNNRNSGSRDTATERPDTDGDGVIDSRDDYPTDSDRSVQLISETDRRNIREDHWRYYTIDLPQSGYVEYSFTVRKGDSIDVFLTNEEEYEYFNEGERFRTYSDFDNMDSVGGDGEGYLSSGKYYILFDNSNRGVAAPPTNFNDDIVEVEFSIEASV